jgi:hypothetical protein
VRKQLWLLRRKERVRADDDAARAGGESVELAIAPGRVLCAPEALDVALSAQTW